MLILLYLEVILDFCTKTEKKNRSTQIHRNRDTQSQIKAVKVRHVGPVLAAGGDDCAENWK